MEFSVEGRVVPSELVCILYYTFGKSAETGTGTVIFSMVSAANGHFVLSLHPGQLHISPNFSLGNGIHELPINPHTLCVRSE